MKVIRLQTSQDAQKCVCPFTMETTFARECLGGRCMAFVIVPELHAVDEPRPRAEPKGYCARLHQGEI